MKPDVKKYLKVFLNLGIAAFVLFIFIFLVPKLLVLFMPFVIGYLIALVASPIVRFFEEKLKVKRKASTALVIIFVIGIVVLCLYFIGAKLGTQLTGFVTELPSMWNSVEADINEMGNRLSVFYEKFPIQVQDAILKLGEAGSTYIGEVLSSIGSPTIAAVGNFAKQLPTIIIAIIMCLLSSYFFIADKSQVSKWMNDYMPESIQIRYKMMKRSLGRAVGGYFKAQLKIEVWMYLLLVIGFSILGVEYAFLISIGIAFLDLLPFFGTGTVLVPWTIVQFLSGDYKMAIGLMIIWGVGQLARQLIQPKIVGDSIGVPPIPTLILLFLGYKISGVIGMILAVPLGIILYTMYEEGAFDTTVYSLKILIHGINKFRRLTDEDLEEINKRKNNDNRLDEKKRNSPGGFI